MEQNELIAHIEELESFREKQMDSYSKQIPKGKLEEAKWIVKEYEGSKLRAAIRRKKRPQLMKRLNVKLDSYNATGVVDYNHEEAAFLIPEDQAYFRNFLMEMDIVWTVDRAIALIPDEITRTIAKEMLRPGFSNNTARKKYELSERSIRRKKAAVIKAIASMLT